MKETDQKRRSKFPTFHKKPHQKEQDVVFLRARLSTTAFFTATKEPVKEQKEE